MAAKLGEAAWTPEILKTLAECARAGHSFKAIAEIVFERHGLKVSDRTIGVRLHKFSLIAPAIKADQPRRYNKKNPPAAAPQPVKTPRRNGCRFEIGAGYCGKPRKSDYEAAS